MTSEDACVRGTSGQTGSEVAERPSISWRRRCRVSRGSSVSWPSRRRWSARSSCEHVSDGQHSTEPRVRTNRGRCPDVRVRADVRRLPGQRTAGRGLERGERDDDRGPRGPTAIAILVALFAPLIMRLFFIGNRGRRAPRGVNSPWNDVPQCRMRGPRRGDYHDGCPAREPSLHPRPAIAPILHVLEPSWSTSPRTSDARRHARSLGEVSSGRAAGVRHAAGRRCYDRVPHPRAAGHRGGSSVQVGTRLVPRCK